MGSPQERAPKPETSVPSVMLDPREVAQGLLSRHIVNPQLLLKGKEVGKFDPDWYASQPAEVVRVGSSPDNVAYRPYNGFNRLSSAVKHVEGLVAASKPGDEVQTTIIFNDVTRKIMEADKYKGDAQTRGYLTPSEWSAEVVDSTIVHGDHRFRRVATVLMDEWEQNMGEDVDKFTALAAMSILGRSNFRMNTLDKNVVHTAIAGYSTQFFGGETIAEREKIIHGLEAMADVIIDSKLGYTEVQAGAFEVVTGLFEDIGPEERERQIRGLALLPSPYAKAMSVNPTRGQDRIEELQRVLVDRYKKITDKRSAASEAMRVKSTLEQPMLFRQLLTKLDPQTYPPETKRTPSATPSERGLPPPGNPTQGSEGAHRSTREVGRVSEQVLVSAVHLLERQLERLPKGTQLSTVELQSLRQLREKIDGALNGSKGDVKLALKSGAPGPNGTTWSERLSRFVKGSRETVTLLEGIGAQVDAERARGETIPSVITEHPDELFVDSWQRHAACQGKEAQLDVEGARQVRAKEICRGCPVTTICLATELRQEDQNFARGGQTARERRAMKRDKAATAALLSGVNEARVFHSMLARRVTTQ